MVNSFTLPTQSVPKKKQPTLPSWHFTDVGEKNAREIILHPVRSSRLLISRYCSEKCFDVLKRLKGGSRRGGGGGRRRKSRKQRSKQYNLMSYFSWRCLACKNFVYTVFTNGLAIYSFISR